MINGQSYFKRAPHRHMANQVVCATRLFANIDSRSRQASVEGDFARMADTLGQSPHAFPLSFEEIEGLVKTLYDPGHAKKIPETEATLRVLQRSPQGWEIGDALLNSTDENVRFFGALTFTVKLNADLWVTSSIPPSLHPLTHFIVLR
jgi:hypothetical protein